MKVAKLGFLLASILLSPAWAQQLGNVTQPQADSSDLTLGEVVVTARRREENLSDVPISISAIGRDQITERNILDENDLQQAVPGLIIRQNGNANAFNYAIRGQTIDTYTNSPPGVLPYIDEAQIVSHSATPFYDLEDIQVLKGPQGTLFGRNTTGGAVLYETVKPKDEFSGYAQVTYSNFNWRQIQAAVTLPLSTGLSMRVAGDYAAGGAYIRSLDDGENIGDQGTKSARVTVVFSRIEGLTNTTVGQYQRDEGTNTPQEAFSAYAPGSTYNGHALYTAGPALYSPPSPAFLAYIAAHPNIYQGGVLAFTAYQNLLGPYSSDNNVPLFHNARNAFGINTTTYQLSPNLTVKNILAFNNSESQDGFDYDGTPYPIFQTLGTPTANAQSVTNPLPYELSTTQLSDELQLQGKALDSALTYVIGGYFLNQRDVFDSNLYAFDLSPIATGVTIFYHSHLQNKSLAGFGQATYKLTDQLNLTGGFRYTNEKDFIHQDRDSSLYNPALTAQSLSNSKPSWTLSLDYKITPNLLAYATTRGSWRAGGFNYSVFPDNGTAVTGGNEFKPETTRDVEVGMKFSGNAMGMPMSFDVDVYNQWIYDIQRAAYVPGVGGSPNLLTANIPSAQVTGFEGDFSVRPISWLLLGVSGAYTDARYTNGNVTILGTAFSYGPYADAPKVTGSVYEEFSRSLAGDLGTIRFRTDVYAQTNFYFSNVANTIAPGTQIAGYGLTNMRLTWADLIRTKLSASLYVRNVFDKAYYAGGNAVAPSLGINVVNPGVPRMYGGELHYDF
jgi:iron complex outermembrane recepter protein